MGFAIFLTVGYEKNYIYCIILSLSDRFSVMDHSLPFPSNMHIVLPVKARIMSLLLLLLFLVSLGHMEFDNNLLSHSNIL